jgi:hypothetical protein
MKVSLSTIIALFITGTALAAPPPPVTALAYHPGGKLLVAGTHGEVLLIDPAKGDVVGSLPGVTGRVTALAFTRAGDRLAAASGEPGKAGVIRLYEVKDGAAKLLREWSPHTDIIYALAFSPDGVLASAGYDRVIRLHGQADVEQPRGGLQDHSDAVYGLAFSPDGKLLASASADRTVKVWDVAARKRLYTLSDPTDWVYAVAWSPDAKHLAAAGIDKSIRVWEATAEGGKLVHSVFAHTQPVNRLVYAADGKALLSAGEGKNLKSWDAATMKEKLVFPEQTETILSLALAPDGKQLAVGFFDGKLKLLAADTGKTTAEPLPAKPKPPELKKLTPTSGVRGKTVRVAFEGANLGNVTEITGVPAKLVAEGRTPTRIEADVTFPADAAPGVVNLGLKSPAGASANLPFTVDRYPAVAETGAKDSPRIGMKVALPATLVGVIHKAGDADYFRFDVKAGQEVAVQALTAAVGSKLDPLLELTNEDGKVIAESANGLLGYIAPKAGTLALGVRDKEFRGGPDFTYRLSVGDFPLVTGVVPLSVERGKETELELLGVNLGAKRRLRFVASDAAPGTKVPLQLPTLSEKPAGSAQVVVGEFPHVAVASDSAAVPVPGTATGVIRAPGAAQIVTFPAKKGQRLVVEVEARRLGAPLDSVIEIEDAQGRPVQRATLRCAARTFVTFRDHDSAGSGIRLETWNELAMDDYLYVGGELMRIRDLPKNPDDDCQFYAVAGQRVGYLGTTPTHHAQGTAMYKVEMHPPGTTFPPNGLPVFRLPYRNDDGGPGLGKDSRLVFDPPADGTYRVKIGDARGQGGPDFAYRLTVRPPRPDFTVSLAPASPSVGKGASTALTATATRLDDYDGPIALKLEIPPPGFEAPASFIEAGQVSATFALFAAPTAAVPEKAAPLKLVARATIDGKEVVREATGGVPKLIDPGDIVTTTNVPEVTVRPGQQTRLLVTVERRNGFAGRIPLEVRGLPHGVRVLDIGLNGILVTERDTQREVVIYAEPWVKPMELPFVVIAKREGKNTEHGAKSVLLKVAK